MNTRIYDISVSPAEINAVYSDDPPTIIRKLADINSEGYRLTGIEMSLHAGTHIDFPAHYLSEGGTAADFPLEKFLLTAWVTDVEQAEIIIPQLKAGQALLLRTRQPLPNKNNLLVTEKLARQLVERQIALVGIDQLSIDNGADNAYPIHHILLQAQVLILENLDLTGVPDGQYHLICLPLKVGPVEAAPVRAVLLPI